MNGPDSQPPADSRRGSGFVDPFAGERELPISAPPPEAGPGGGPIPSVYRSQLDAPMRVKIPLPITLAILFHVALFAAAFIIPKLTEKPTPLRPIFITKMMVLGKPRDPKLMPRKDVPPPPPPPSTAPSPQPTPAPSKPSTPSPSAEPKPSTPRPKQPSREEQMERALAQATKNVDKQEHKVKPEEREGSETGSVDGNSSSAEEGDKYFSAVQAAILANYSLPSIISEKERMSLTATVDAWISRDGTIVKHQFEHRSGNQFFDDALEVAIKRTKCPPPPADRAAEIAKDGVALVFTP